MIGLAVALLLAAAPPEAPPAAPAAPAVTPATADAAAPPQKSKSEKVCWDEAPTGTRFSHRVCATREQIDQRRKDDQDWKMMMRPQPAAGG
jgi:hypothetical protein